MWLKPETVEHNSKSQGKIWKDRGIGFFKIKRDNVKREIKCIMRQERTLKVAANFVIAPFISLTKAKSGSRLIFSAHDCSENTEP
jgi:Ran-binding protein 1